MTLTLPTLRSLCLGIDIAEKIGVYRAVVNREESGGGGRGVGPRLLPCSAAWALSPGFWPFEVFGSGIFPSSECYLRQNMGCQQGQQPAQQPAAASGNLGLGTWDLAAAAQQQQQQQQQLFANFAFAFAFHAAFSPCLSLAVAYVPKISNFSFGHHLTLNNKPDVKHREGLDYRG